MPKQISSQKTDQSNKAWQAHIKAWGKSGLSGKEYCRQRQLSYHAFIYWKKKLVPRQSAATFFVPVPMPTNLHSGATGSGLKVEVGKRFKIEVHDGFMPRTLARVISVLEEYR
ncbi:MAG: IS66 family insertion sequence element accessory protein TnpB [Desulfobulbaceae bacterium]|uniref:IS66 family insertion sequence element accessory protein TnpB n=1 Tax=Candidatus Desulfobia pelagia TaxID=2841692 RepID=A0A8J6TFZ0_9BACT|nr:IS66 family insertion sequence element accessory protein TnpB [Candidatus Desulfobia pelagia]